MFFWLIQKINNSISASGLILFMARPELHDNLLMSRSRHCNIKLDNSHSANPTAS